ncbi:exodeoxyribonuclease VII large subunit [bacterium]|nr:exodeoxyribonuclease VII large subunit [bacterium]
MENFKTLSQLNNYLQRLVDSKLGGKKFWLKAEISNINFHRSGHTYLDFVEQKDGRIVAKSRAMIWKTEISNIKQNLGDDFNNILTKGKEILCQVSVSFHPEYGMGISIFQVDLSFSIGELEKRRLEALKKLKEQNLLETNKQRSLPLVIQKIAIIAAEGSSGYEDLLKQLDNNQYGFYFKHQLFNASVQGKSAIGEIVSQLTLLSNSDFEAIILIRGGGSKLDLEAFDSFEVSKAIAVNKKPVITGIGHETDVSVADIVANTHLKTPSAVGSFIVERASRYKSHIETTYQAISKRYQVKLEKENKFVKLTLTNVRNTAINYTQLKRGKLHQEGNRIVRLTKTRITENQQTLAASVESIKHFYKTKLSTDLNELMVTSQKIFATAKSRVSEQKSRSNEYVLSFIAAKNAFIERRLSFIHREEVKLINIHPDRILKRGFSVVRKGNNAITETTKLIEGDLLEIELYRRKIYAQFLNEEPEWKKLKELLTKKPQKS